MKALPSRCAPSPDCYFCGIGRFELMRECPSAIDKRYADVCFGLFVAGGIVGLLQLSAPISLGAGFEMVAIAKNLVEHGNFANPFWALNTGPTAANPPLYPVFLAVLIKLLRVPLLVSAAVVTGNIAANALTASLIPRISLLFYGDIIPGVVASILWLASVQLLPAWDTSYTVAGLIIFCLITPSFLEPEKKVGFSILAGVVGGLLFLLNPSSVIITLLWIAYLVSRRRARLIETAIALTILSLIIFAWAARNDRQLGAMVVRTNLGMTLYASNNDCAESSMIADELHNCYQSHHPNTSESEALLLRTLGEVKYDRMRIADVKTWVLTHPRNFGLLTLKRFREFWFPPLQEHPAYIAGVIWLATALSIAGLFLMILRREPVTLFVLTTLFVYPLMYYVVVSDVRYRYPVLWLSLLPAGYCVRQLLDKRPNLFLSFRKL